MQDFRLIYQPCGHFDGHMGHYRANDGYFGSSMVPWQVYHACKMPTPPRWGTKPKVTHIWANVYHFVSQHNSLIMIIGYFYPLVKQINMYLARI